MSVAHLRIKKLNFTFVFRHKYEKDLSQLDKLTTWRDYKLGLFYKSNLIVGRKNFQHTSEWKNNMVRSHMLGINLLVAKAWVEVNRNGMEIEVE